MNSKLSEELDTLLASLGNGEITAKDRARLSEIVESDAEAKEVYLDYMMAEAELQWRFGKVESGDLVGGVPFETAMDFSLQSGKFFPFH